MRLPICQWIFSLARALPTSGQEQGPKQSPGVGVSWPLYGFRVLFAHPAPERSSPPPNTTGCKAQPMERMERNGPEQLFKRGGGEENAVSKATTRKPLQSRGGPGRACACRCVRCDDKAPLPSASSRLLERGWGRGRESSRRWNPRSRR